MKTPIAVRSNNYLFNSLLIFSGITFMLVWLPLLRCLFDGKSYSWGQDYFGLSFSSSGVESDYFVLILFLLFFILFFYSFYWIKNRVIFYALLILWWIHTFGNLLFGLIRDGDSIFQGDTLDVNVSISMILIPLSILALLLIVAIILKDRKKAEVSIPWNKRNTIKALLILGPLPLQAIMYATGEPHGLTDEISVIITILQSFLIPTIFFPSKAK
tara:strand:- start:10448 stop:11092 length:645 start_codon:yes stop_codon:yes gene_type:complete